jgi:hypothetical protein
MKLKNRNPANFVGRIIIHRHQSWKIQSVIGDTIYLCRDYLDHKGQLKLHQFADCRLFPTHAEVQARYPKLIRALCWMFKLTQEEAVKAVRGQVLEEDPSSHGCLGLFLSSTSIQFWSLVARNRAVHVQCAPEPAGSRCHTQGGKDGKRSQ